MAWIMFPIPGKVKRYSDNQNKTELRQNGTTGNVCMAHIRELPVA